MWRLFPASLVAGSLCELLFFPHVQLSIHGGDRPLLIVGLGLN